ncbi:hypothetical protein [Streptomyces sp. NPDC059080]|uniref:hypothetical protein n=1 Tax=Streptomyces sp. NPDC059080 TaxID=3346718 RepID=UPI0036B4D3EC
MAMSRKHYRETAGILHDALRCHPAATDVVTEIAGDLSRMFKRDNSRFSPQQFMDAVLDDTPQEKS